MSSFPTPCGRRRLASPPASTIPIWSISSAIAPSLSSAPPWNLPNLFLPSIYHRARSRPGNHHAQAMTVTPPRSPSILASVLGSSLPRLIGLFGSNRDQTELISGSNLRLGIFLETNHRGTEPIGSV
jgi:hypothetical protein